MWARPRSIRIPETITSKVQTFGFSRTRIRGLPSGVLWYNGILAGSILGVHVSPKDLTQTLPGERP